ncbi:MAG: DUF4261 domain-containing protein [Micrococcales bacterium]|nr:DUF4261 domain-containing protein [Micrococcales bacterium]
MSVVLAMLLHSQAGPVQGEALVAQLKADWPGIPEPTGLEDNPGGPLSFSCADDFVALMPVEATIGDDLPQIVGPSRLWPNARPAPDYQAHTIVTVLSPEGSNPVANTALLSQVMASAIRVSSTVVAVYWGAANHVIVPELFVELAHETLPDPMLMAWVALNCGVNPSSGLASGFSQGMDMLGLMDVEIPDTTEGVDWVFERLQSICFYQVDNGPVIGDGDTISATADGTRTVAVHAPSALGDDRTVLRLETGAPAPKRRWFHR